MHKLDLAYYIGRDKNPAKRLVTTIIRLATGKYSHVELVFPVELYKENSFSSSGWDGGVRFKKINYSHPERWRFQRLGEFNAERIAFIYSCAKLYEGKKYATFDVIKRFGFGKPANDPDKFWCSEVCLRVLNDCNMFGKKIKVTLAPTRMYNYLSRLLKKEK